MVAMSDAFVSYARQDADFVSTLIAGLGEHRKTVWVDQGTIEASEDWKAAIFRGIESAQTFLFVLSRHSAESTVCGEEVRHAVAHGKKILVLPLESLPTALIPGRRHRCRSSAPRAAPPPEIGRTVRRGDRPIRWSYRG